ncbi:MAG: hypothetical protein ACRD3T_21350, partial [Terriglobia bacterium]
DMVVEPLGTRNNGVLPPGLGLNPAIAARCQTLDFVVKMRASFPWITAGNPQAREYKEWANWLFAGLKKNLEN